MLLSCEHRARNSETVASTPLTPETQLEAERSQFKDGCEQGAQHSKTIVSTMLTAQRQLWGPSEGYLLFHARAPTFSGTAAISEQLIPAFELAVVVRFPWRISARRPLPSVPASFQLAVFVRLSRRVFSSPASSVCPGPRFVFWSKLGQGRLNPV